MEKRRESMLLLEILVIFFVGTKFGVFLVRQMRAAQIAVI
jgi:hypothetical protein